MRFVPFRVQTGKHPNGTWCEFARGTNCAVAWYQCSRDTWEIHFIEGRRARMVGHSPSREACLRIAQELLAAGGERKVG